MIRIVLNCQTAAQVIAAYNEIKAAGINPSISLPRNSSPVITTGEDKGGDNNPEELATLKEQYRMKYGKGFRVTLEQKDMLDACESVNERAAMYLDLLKTALNISIDNGEETPLEETDRDVFA
jgi:hypothetical protein